MQNLMRFVWLIALFSLNCQALELLPNSISEVPTMGPLTKKIGGSVYTKSSAVFEHKYNNIKLKSKNTPEDTLVLDLDENAVGFSIVIYTQKKSYGYVYELRDPNNTAVISAVPADISDELLKRSDVNGRGQVVSPNPALPEVFNDISITAVPNSDLVKVVPGKWKFSIAIEDEITSSNDTYRVSVFVKKAKTIGTKTRGQVTLSFATTLEAKFGQSKKDIESLMTEPALFYKNLGIDLVVKDHKPLAPYFDDACDDFSQDCFKKLEELFKISRKDGREAGEIKVFFTKRNNFCNYGIANLNGSVSSLFTDKNEMFDGVFIMTDQGGPTKAKNTFSHELGHHLGLLHTDQDNITDTRDGLHLYRGKQNPASANLMNSGSGPDTITEGQKYVLIRAVAVELYEQQNPLK